MATVGSRLCYAIGITIILSLPTVQTIYEVGKYNLWNPDPPISPSQLMSSLDTAGISVNARLISDNTSYTFIGTVSIIRKNVIIIVKPHIIIVNRERFQWNDITAFLIRGHRVVISMDLIAVTFRNLNVTAIVKRHETDQNGTASLSYLGFYLSDARGFSPYTHGLLGQFLHKTVEIENLRYRNNRAKARLSVTSPLNPIPRRAMAILGSKMNRALNTSTPCWVLRQDGRGVVDGRYDKYVVNSMRDISNLELQ